MSASFEQQQTVRGTERGTPRRSNGHCKMKLKVINNYRTSAIQSNNDD